MTGKCKPSSSSAGPMGFWFFSTTVAMARLEGLQVTPDFFELFEAAPLHGRTFRPEDGTRGASGVAVLSHRLWQEVGDGAPNRVSGPARL